MLLLITFFELGFIIEECILFKNVYGPNSLIDFYRSQVNAISHKLT